MKQGLDYDLLIAGGGMVGASLACALAPLGLRIGVIEPVAHTASEQPSFDDRSIALSLGSQRIFSGIGLWPELVSAATAIKTIHVSDRGHFGVTRLYHDEQNVDALGYVMISRDVGSVLQKHMAGLERVDVLCPARLAGLQAQDDRVLVTVEQAGVTRRISARLLVAADGGNSKTRELLGMPVRHWDYGQDAVIANVTSSQWHRNVAYERFTTSGPLAVLPLTQGRSAIVWTVQRQQVESVMALSDDRFQQQLQSHFGYRLGVFTRVGVRASYPLSLISITEPVAARALVIGNAAHSLHPIAGQGFNLGLRDVAVLAEVLAAALRQRQDIGTPAVLQEYARRQSKDQCKTTAITDALVRTFSNRFPPAVLARNTGLLALELMPPLRRKFATHAMGLAGAVSRLGRGVGL